MLPTDSVQSIGCVSLVLWSSIVSRTKAVRGDGTPISEMVSEMDTTTSVGAVASAMRSEVVAGDPTTTTSPVVGVSQTAASTTSAAIGDDAPEEPEVVMGHPDLGAPGQVSVPKAVDMALFALQQEQNVFLR
jgi:hypothetical protein